MIDLILTYNFFIYKDTTIGIWHTFQNLDRLFPIQIYKTIEIKVYTTSTKVNELNDSLNIYHDYLLNVVKSNDRILLKR